MSNPKRRRISNTQLDRQLALARRALALKEAKILRDGIATREQLDRMAEEIEQPPPLGNGSMIEWGDGIYRIESHTADGVIVTEVGRTATSTAP